MRYRLLEPVRGLAALWVFLFHLPFADASRAVFPAFMQFCQIGHLGVPMFFVISGYCITVAGRKTVLSDQATGQFLYRRFRRIYPAYWFSIALVTLVPFAIEGLSALKTGHYVAPSADNLNLGFLRYSVAEWVHVATLTHVFAIVPGATDLQYKFTTINAVYWTLAIEVQFYLVAALAVWSRRYFYHCLAFVTVLSVPAALMPSLYLSGIFLPYWPMFAIGIAIAFLFERGVRPSLLVPRTAVWWAGAVVSCATVAVAVLTDHVQSASPMFFAVAFGFVVFAAEGLEDLYGRGLQARVLAVNVICRGLLIAGAMSYSLYLVHSRLQFLAMQISRQVVSAEWIAHDVLAIVATLMLAYVFHLFCEKPFMSMSSGRRLSSAKLGEAVSPS